MKINLLFFHQTIFILHHSQRQGFFFIIIDMYRKYFHAIYRRKMFITQKKYFHNFTQRKQWKNCSFAAHVNRVDFSHEIYSCNPAMVPCLGNVLISERKNSLQNHREKNSNLDERFAVRFIFRKRVERCIKKLLRIYLSMQLMMVCG